MQRHGMSIQLILEMTGLTEAEFNQLQNDAGNQ